MYIVWILDILIFVSAASLSLAKENDAEWSSMFCIGAPWYYHTLKPRVFRTNCRPACLFKHVTWDESLKTLLFHRHPKDSHRPLLVDGKGNQLFDFPPSFSFRKMSIKVVNRPFRYGRVEGSLSSERQTNIVANPPASYGNNFGHIIWSWYVPLFTLLGAFQVLPEDGVITLTGNATSRLDALGEFLSPNPPELLGSPRNAYSRLILADMVCEDRKNLLAVVSRPSISGFTAHLTKLLAVSQSKSPLMAAPFQLQQQQQQQHQPLVTVLLKRGRRRPLNHNEVVSFLKKEFPGVRVVSLDVTNVTMQFQLSLLSRTTLLISPAGGISCAAPFLSSGATLLQFGLYSEELGSAYDYDSFQLAEFTHISTVIFPVRKEELDENTCSYSVKCESTGKFHPVNSRGHKECLLRSNVMVDPQISDWGKLVYCSYRVNLQRLRYMVAETIGNWGLFQFNKRRTWGGANATSHRIRNRGAKGPKLFV